MCGNPRPCPPYAFPVIKTDEWKEYKKDFNYVDTEKEYHEGIKRIKNDNSKTEQLF